MQQDFSLSHPLLVLVTFNSLPLKSPPRLLKSIMVRMSKVVPFALTMTPRKRSHDHLVVLLHEAVGVGLVVEVVVVASKEVDVVAAVALVEEEVVVEEAVVVVLVVEVVAVAVAVSEVVTETIFANFSSPLFQLIIYGYLCISCIDLSKSLNHYNYLHFFVGKV